MHQQTKSSSPHFHGKEALEHVIEARLKGHAASEEIHGVEMPGHISALTDAAKETSLLFVVLWIILSTLHLELSIIHWTLLIFAGSWLVWKTGRSALLGWTRLERMHRVIEEERWEIEHHRPQEREELSALYKAKGFSGPLLEEVIDTLMADDNRLLQVMLQEELGFRMESEEHPLKQATGAALGVVVSSAVMAFALFFLPPIGTILSGALVIACTAGLTASFERNLVTRAIIWNLGVASLSLGSAYFALQLVFAE